MKGFTIQNSIDLLEKKGNSGGGGGETSAADVSYDNTSSHLTADDVQEAIDEINAKIVSTASGISYDNTSSGLTADDVQEAIDELAERDAGDISYDNTGTGLIATNVQGAIDEVNTKINTFTTSEREVGQWLSGEKIYQKTLSVDTSAGTTTTVDISDLNIDDVISISGGAVGVGYIPIGYYAGASNYLSVRYYDGDLIIEAPAQYANGPVIVTIQYTKTASTRKKKGGN